ncbi:pentapeptide repeat-containing protein [Nostoc sp.]|uniref:pentapeptide repeat-containing protein n=1 Tax=Nostoc sp. TaxID=1180 RepID=UPI003FA570A3
MRNAQLGVADLTTACLESANLTRASLRGANLFQADLSMALLIETNFASAINFNISYENTDGAFFWKTILPDGTVEVGPRYNS